MPSPPSANLIKRSQWLKALARDLGFDLVAIVPVAASPHYERYQRWIKAGYGGEMHYLADHLPLKADPRTLLPDARSLILVALNYNVPIDPALRSHPGRGQIASYALGHDYHKLMRKALIQLDRQLAARVRRSSHGRVFVDSAPVLERSWAQQGGLGFIGKNTCLIHPRLGSNLFLGGLLVPEHFAYDAPPRTFASNTSYWQQFADGTRGTCGRCRRCLQACPTQAFVQSYELDARKCISYLTIELKGDIPLALRPAMGNWVFGCDICQQVCPWNRHKPPTTHPRLQPPPDRVAPPLAELLSLTEADFAQRFQGSAVRRARWSGFMRNVCVAAGNWGHPSLLATLENHLFESPELVASHAAWALGRLQGGVGRQALEKALARTNSQPLQGAIRQALTLSPT